MKGAYLPSSVYSPKPCYMAILSFKVTSIGLKGLEGYRVQVEVQVIEGIESVLTVSDSDSDSDASMKESKEQVSAAFHFH
jgi:magnesium chelatase family protein